MANYLADAGLFCFVFDKKDQDRFFSWAEDSSIEYIILEDGKQFPEIEGFFCRYTSGAFLAFTKSESCAMLARLSFDIQASGPSEFYFVKPADLVNFI